MKHKINEYYVSTSEGAKDLINFTSSMKHSCGTYDFDEKDQIKVAIRIAEIEDSESRTLALEVMQAAMRLYGKLIVARSAFEAIDKVLKGIAAEETEEKAN
jgi:hypothetical protein